MRPMRLAVILVTAVLASACGDLLSLHPLYTDQDRVLDPSIEGVWRNDDDRITVERDGEAYHMKLENIQVPSDTATYDVRLVDLGGVRFADLLREDTIGHMFVRVRVADGKLRLAFLDSKWLRARVPHENARQDANRTQAVLIQHTADLRAIVARYASEPKAYDEEIVFHR